MSETIGYILYNSSDVKHLEKETNRKRVELSIYEFEERVGDELRLASKRW